MTFNGFEYNDYGVCLNPEIPYQFGKWGQYRFKIAVSETPGGWTYGYDWSTLSGGGGGGSFLDSNKVFPLRSKAIVAAAKYIRGCYGKDPKAAKAIAELDRIIAVESERKPVLKQFTIFDYL